MARGLNVRDMPHRAAAAVRQECVPLSVAADGCGV